MEQVLADPDPYLPWYRATTASQPFTLARLCSSLDGNTSPFHCTATFPWTADSLITLWDGVVTDEEIISNWKATVDEYSGSVAVGSTGRLYVFPKFTAGKPFCLRLHDVSWEVSCAAWAINSDLPTDPLVVFTASSAIFILDVKTRKIIGRLRGHGGPITSIAVHPYHPYLFCTTSRDFTTRIYDLTLQPVQKPNNPHWPPAKHPSLAGPAHGLHMSESEGDGIGRCVAVLVGGRSGGHRGAVFCAAFHPSAPLIATCGMDRAVKIWRMPPYKPETLSREDKPLFSTDLIHKARVLSIAWLSGDILVSHSAPALMRGTSVHDVYEENGTIAVWQWLGFDRFFPPGKPIQKVMRGGASDYRNSESFKILSAYHLPLTTLNLTVYTSAGQTHDPLILIPIGKIIRVFNVTHFGPRDPPPFPVDDEVVALTKRMRLDDGGGGEGTADGESGADGDGRSQSDRVVAPQHEGDSEPGAEDNAADDEEEPEDDVQEFRPAPQPSRLAELFESVEGWDIDVTVNEPRRSQLPDITTCEVACHGRVILGAGANGTLYIWRLK